MCMGGVCNQCVNCGFYYTVELRYLYFVSFCILKILYNIKVPYNQKNILSKYYSKNWAPKNFNSGNYHLLSSSKCSLG